MSVKDSIHKILIKRSEFIEELLKKNYKEIINYSIIIGEAIKNTAKNNGKIIIFGNGGSHCQSSHLATELLVRFKQNSSRPPIPAFSISSDSGVLTACSNDYSFDYIFERQIDSILNPNDCVIGFSTSGKSPNVLNGLLKASEKIDRNKIFLITGKHSNNHIESKINLIPSPIEGNTEIYQEYHLLLVHLICNVLEEIYD